MDCSSHWVLKKQHSVQISVKQVRRASSPFSFVFNTSLLSFSFCTVFSNCSFSFKICKKQRILLSSSYCNKFIFSIKYPIIYETCKMKRFSQFSLYIHINTYTYINKKPSTLMSFLQAQVLYQRPGSLRVLRSFLAVPNCWSHPPSLGVTAPSAPITTGSTAAFNSHIFLTPSFRPWYF